jgi:prepilin-type N-terminal cleavage/methylation domain-containing protein/prepilin-type processing-associated H-X9-DG protein
MKSTLHNSKTKVSPLKATSTMNRFLRSSFGSQFSTTPRVAVSGFTLIELLVVVAIIGVLASLIFSGVQGAMKSSAQTKSVAAIRSVLQANTLYANDNKGQIVILRDEGEKLMLNPGGKWVGNTFWGTLQPYLFTGITTTNQSQLGQEILAQLNKLFGSPNLAKMTGTPFAGARIYGDTSGLPVPFSFNKYLRTWNDWVRQQQVYSLPSTIYVTYGIYYFDEADAQTYQPMAKVGETVVNNIYYLPSKRAIAGFLDGHVALMAPPIAEKHVKIADLTQ